MTDKEFLSWLLDRLVHVYGESPNVDFVHRLRKIVGAKDESPRATWARANPLHPYFHPR